VHIAHATCDTVPFDMDDDTANNDPRVMGRVGAERISAGCYGALVSASTLVGLGDAEPATIIAVVTLTNLVYFVTHVFAYTLGDTSGGPLGRALLHHAWVSAPMVSVTFVPLLVVLVLAASGVGMTTALLWGVGTAMLYLVSVAVVGARLRGLSVLGVIVVGILAAAISALLIAAKLLLH
jgi:hypothetical protein